MLPSIFGENLFDDFFGDPFGMMPRGRDPLYGKHAKNLMRTDVRETEDAYELDVDLPGFKKDEVTLELKDGCLTIQAVKGLDKDASDKKGKYIRQERYAGACSRSCGVILRIRYWMEMELLLGSCFFAFLGTETVRMPSSNLAETSSGSTASPT